MHRLIARFLLLMAVAGNFVPLATAVTFAKPVHACCMRKQAHAHSCHGAAADSSQLTVHAISCCDHDCCRAVTTAQAAHPRTRAANVCGRFVSGRTTESQINVPASSTSSLQSTRAPPFCSLA